MEPDTTPTKTAGMVELIRMVNSLQELFTSSGIPMSLPRIVTVGGQSAGKSSVLEGFVGKDFLPRGSDIVTRRPLVLQLHQSEEEYATFLHTGERRFTIGDEVRREIEEDTERVTGTNRGISDEEITLRIYSPNVVSLTLVDLPGMTKNPVGEQPPDIETQIINMVRKYADDKNTIILAVTPANQDIANSEALKIARDMDPEGDRTIGVITKLDLMDKGTNARDVLGNKILPLKKGYIGVVNRSQDDINKQITINYSIPAERNFFLNNPDYADIIDDHGMSHLQNVLHEELGDAIRKKLPEIRNQLDSKRRALDASLMELGFDETSIQERPKNDQKTLITLVAQFTKAFGGKLDVEEGHVQTDHVNTGPIINRKFYKEFIDIIVDPFKANPDIDEEVKVACVNAHGLNTPMFPSEKVLHQVAGKIISSYEESMVSCVKEIKAELEKAVEESLDVVDGFMALQEEVRKLVREEIDRGETATVQHLINHVKAQQAFMNVRHPHFNNPYLEEARETQTTAGTQNGEWGSMGKTVGKEVGGAAVGAAGTAAGTSVGGPLGGTIGGGVGKVVGGALGGAVGEKVGDKMGERKQAPDEGMTPETKKKGWLNGFKKEKNLDKNVSTWHSSTLSLDSEPDDNHSTSNPKSKNSLRVSKETETRGKAILKEPKIKEEANMVKKMVGDYMKIVHTTMRDLAPKYIMFSLVDALRKYLDYKLLGELLDRHNSDDAVVQLLQWQKSSQVSRLLASRGKIHQALEVVAKFSQDKETITTVTELGDPNLQAKYIQAYKDAEVDLWHLLTGKRGGASPKDIYDRIMSLDRVPNANKVHEVLGKAIENAQKSLTGDASNHEHEQRITCYSKIQRHFQAKYTQAYKDAEVHLWDLLTGKRGGASPKDIYERIMSLDRVPKAKEVHELLGIAYQNAADAQMCLTGGAVADSGHNHRINLYRKAYPKVNKQVMNDKYVDEMAKNL